MDAAEPTPRALTRLEKVVAVMSAMGRPVASRLVEHFDERERGRMLVAARDLGDLPPDVLEGVVAEFEAAFVAGVGAIDNLTHLEAVFDRRLADGGERKVSVWVEAERSSERLGTLLEGENPQLAVVLAARLPPAAVARMLAALPPSRAADIVRRTAAATPVSDAVASLVETHLRELLRDGPDTSDDPSRLTAILNEMDRDVAEAMLTEASLPDDTATRVRSGLFGFSDIVWLGAEDRTTLLDGVEGETLVAALHEAAGELAEAVLGALSPRTRRMVEAQRAGARVAALAAQEARRSVAARARTLAADGAITLPASERAA